MDLTLLQAVERAAERHLCDAVADLAANDPIAAARAIMRALTLQRTPLAVCLATFIDAEWR
jgi:hypothetical protein